METRIMEKPPEEFIRNDNLKRTIRERPSGREAPAGVAALEAWSPMTL